MRALIAFGLAFAAVMATPLAGHAKHPVPSPAPDPPHASLEAPWT
jgi:hypothetical protein